MLKNAGASIERSKSTRKNTNPLGLLKNYVKEKLSLNLQKKEELKDKKQPIETSGKVQSWTDEYDNWFPDH